MHNFRCGKIHTFHVVTRPFRNRLSWNLFQNDGMRELRRLKQLSWQTVTKRLSYNMKRVNFPTSEVMHQGVNFISPTLMYIIDRIIKNCVVWNKFHDKTVTKRPSYNTKRVIFPTSDFSLVTRPPARKKPFYNPVIDILYVMYIHNIYYIGIIKQGVTTPWYYMT